MNGTNDERDASGTTNERLDQLLSLRQDGALDARETAELEALLSASGAAGERARARAQAFAEVDESLRRLAARVIPPARLARGLEAIERRVGAERAGLSDPSLMPRRSASRLGRFGLGLGLAAAAALVFALLVTARREVDEPSSPPTLARTDAAEGATTGATNPPTAATVQTESRTIAATTPPSTKSSPPPTASTTAPTTEVAIEATPDGVDGTQGRGAERVDDSTGAPVSLPQVAEAESDLGGRADPISSSASTAEELASLGLEEASDLEVIDELDLLDFLATRNPAPEGPRG